MKKSQLNLKISGKLRSNRDMTMLCVSLLVSVLALYLFAGPTYYKERELEKGNGAKKTDLASKKQLLGDLQNFNKDNADLIVSSKKLATFIPSRNNFEDFFTHIKEMAKAGNLEVVSFKLEKDDSAAAATATANGAATATANGATATYADNRNFTLQKQRVTFAVKGDYENIINFSKVLENGIPFIQEDSVKMIAGDANSNIGQVQQTAGTPVMLTSTMAFNFYYY
jgi:hypothetical protein